MGRRRDGFIRTEGIEQEQELINRSGLMVRRKLLRKKQNILVSIFIYGLFIAIFGLILASLMT